MKYLIRAFLIYTAAREHLLPGSGNLRTAP